MQSANWFYAAIIFLLISVGAAFNAVPIINQWVEMPRVVPVAGASGFEALIYALSSLSIKFAALLPAILLVTFAARRHRALFEAKEQYRFKKTVATAIPGFREEAPAHKDAMAAAAFERLLFNSQEQASGYYGGKSRGGFLSRWLVGVVQRALQEAKGDKTTP